MLPVQKHFTHPQHRVSDTNVPTINVLSDHKINRKTDKYKSRRCITALIIVLIFCGWQNTTAQMIATYAGNIHGSLGVGRLGDGGFAVSGAGCHVCGSSQAKLYAPQGLAMDKYGNLFIANPGDSCIRIVSPSDTINSIVGPLYNIWGARGVAVDTGGHIYVASSFTTGTGTSTIYYAYISVFKNDGSSAIVGRSDGVLLDNTINSGTIPGPLDTLRKPVGIVVSQDAGRVYFTDRDQGIVGELYIHFDSGNCILDSTRILINNIPPFDLHYPCSADSDYVRYPTSIALDDSGNLYFAGGVSPTNYVHKVTGLETTTPICNKIYTGSLNLKKYPNGLAVDSAGNIFIADSSRIIEVFSTGSTDPSASSAIIYAGITDSLDADDNSPDCQSAIHTKINFQSPSGAELTGMIAKKGNVWFAENNSKVRVIYNHPIPPVINTPYSSLCFGGAETLSVTPTPYFLYHWYSVGSFTSIVPGVGDSVVVTAIYDTLGDFRVYAIQSMGDCMDTVTDESSATIDVYLPPGPIIGNPAFLCPNETMTLFDSVPGGTGYWGSSRITTILPPPVYISEDTGTFISGRDTGLLYGQDSGQVVTISFTTNSSSGPGCVATVNVVVLPAPEIWGDTQVCLYNTTTIDAIPDGGLWSFDTVPGLITNTETTVDRVDYLSITGLGTGYVMLTYTASYSTDSVSGTCSNTWPMHVYFQPDTIIGVPALICIGDTVALYDSTPGGVWSYSDYRVFRVSPTGVVTATGRGSAIVNYSLGHGCTCSRFITVQTPPSIIVGPNAVCEGGEISLMDSMGGGWWTSEDTLLATVDSFGNVTGMNSTGSTYILYSLTNICGSFTDSTIVTVNTSYQPIIGPSLVCNGSSISFADSTPGGIWLSDTPLVATVTDSGIVTGLAIGMANIYYGDTTTGCITVLPVTVINGPDAISGATGICPPGTLTLSDDTLGGTWSTTDTIYASVDSVTGVVTGIAPGTATITYGSTGGCFVTAAIVVNPLPEILGNNIICFGSGLPDSIALYITASPGSCTSANWHVATATTVGDSIYVHGVAAGRTTINYTTDSGCATSINITVDDAPVVSINDAHNYIFCPHTWQTILTASATGTHPLSYLWSPSGSGISLLPNDSALTVTVDALPATTNFVFTAADALGCAGTATVNVVVATGSCSPCEGADPMHPLRDPGGSIVGGVETLAPSATLTGNYYCNYDLVANGNVSFYDATLEMNANTAIGVAANAALTIKGTHLYSCPSGMWNGITLNTTGSATGIINLTADTHGNGNLVEDAKQAIVVANPANPVMTPYFISCDNTIFNRNWYGITIDNYSPATSTVAGSNYYGFRINNTIFTSRNMSFGMPAYPFAWANTATLKSALPTGGYTAPYMLATYPPAECHHIVDGTIGIVLGRIGKNTYPAYKSIEIGTAATAQADNELNLFDYIYQGISAGNTNLVAHNNSFTNIRNLYPVDSSIYDGGQAIVANMTDSTRYQLILEPTPASHTVAATQNTFYGCKWGVYSNNYYHIRCNNSTIVNNQDYTSEVYDRGTWGYEISTWAYDTVNLNYNSILNTANGISFVSTFAPGYLMHFSFGGHTGYIPIPPRLYAGSLTANNNQVRAAINPATIPAQHQNNAFSIAIQNAINLSGVVAASGMVQTDSNIINDAWHGILVNGFLQQQAQTYFNNITMRPNPNGNFGFGINHTYNRNSQVLNNNVLGSDSVIAMGNDSLRGFYTANCQKPSLSCNNSISVSRGFEFFQQNPNTNWQNNMMQSNNKGYVLNNSFIDSQGHTDTPMNNTWQGAWSPSDLQTYVIHSPSASYSSFHVLNNALSNPLFNLPSNLSTNPDFDYGHAPSAVDTTNGSVEECIANNIESPLHDPRPAFEQIAMNGIEYVTDSDARGWIGQYAAWQYANSDSAFVDSSAIIDTFLALAANSRFAYVSNIEDSILVGNYAVANLLISTPTPPLVGNGQWFDPITSVTIVDDSSSDYITNNYTMFYSTYMKYITGSMTCLDSVNLQYMANLCPSIYGTVVYQSRALFTIVFNQLRVWNDDSCNVSPENTCQCGQNGRKSKIAGNTNTENFAQQRYSLLPNPNNGNFVLKQYITDSKPATIEIWNAIGQTIYYKQIIFINNVYSINIAGIISGVYMLQIMDSSGHTFNFKFVVR